MVNKRNNDESQDDLEITKEDLENLEVDLNEIEEKQGTFNNTLRDKLKACEAEKRDILEESQRAKADFLNAKRRLEEERKRDRERSTISHVESLIPLCDSFQVAMSHKETWEKTDATWRKGIEGIYSQLQNILSSNSVQVIDPTGKEFSPHLHEAVSTVVVEDEKDNDKVISVVQMGYEMTKVDGTTELIRPARVVIGVSN